jgi:peptidoglycan/LPS O-acetylase OafA/YrhL
VLASLQVAVMHITDGWFGPEAQLPWLRSALYAFPGVPIFFFISGLLVARAYRSTPPLEYFRNRSLRIFPALWIALALTLIPAFLNPHCPQPSTTPNWLAWWFTQMSFGQMWTPSFLGGCWHNAFNGGRWTVAVELEFYLLLPLLVIAATHWRRAWWWFAGALAIASVVFQNWLLQRLGPDASTLALIAQASLLPYLWIFLLGVAVQPYLPRLEHWFAGRLFWWCIAYVGVVLLTRAFGWPIGGSSINPLSMVVLCGFVLSFALSFRGLSHKLLRGHDFTYGLYLMHPIVILVLVSIGWTQGLPFAFLALLLSFALAAASWFFVERPYLRRKRVSAKLGSATSPAP